MSDPIFEDGKYLTPEDQKLVQQKTQEMKLHDLLDKLDFRQMQDRQRLADLQSREMKSARLTGTADLARAQEQQREEQEKKFVKERERYVSDFHRANAMTEEIEKSQREDLLKGIDPDKPKLTR